MAERPEPKHFSMIRGFHLADLFTIGNGCAGMAAVFQAMRFLQTMQLARVYAAFALVIAALVFDVLDGRIARWRRKDSPMGREMDSLADVISFGVAPAAIGFACGLNTPLDEVALMYFVACGLSRLARYNVTAEDFAAAAGKVTHFEGTPIPSSILPLGLLILAFWGGSLLPITVDGAKVHLLSLLFVLSGSLMISKTLRIPKP